ncbi:MAG: D-alanine--D-alanine ligase family protein [Chloroflexota bacterium]|nr:D-alanine--D-alanine ligase family protein [Chloroflexota bacterium]
MENKLKLGIIYGGRSGEHDVSLMSARSVLSVIDRNKYDVIEIAITRQGQWFIGEDLWNKLKSEDYDQLREAIFLPSPQNPGIYTRENDILSLYSPLDVVFPVMHGTYSEDGTLQGLLELADVAYVGAGVLGSAVCMDKGLFKDIMIANDIPTLPYVTFNRYMIEQDMETCLQRAETIGDYPLFTKPANLGSSVGISKCENQGDLAEGLVFAAQYDRRIVIEKGIDKAREIEVSVLGNEYPTASIPGEIIPKDIFYTYKEKYINDTAELLIPADISQEMTTQVQFLALKAYKAVDCAGMGRVDFLIDLENDGLYLNEINTIPGFTKISMYPKLWEASDLPYPELIEKLIDLALARKSQRDQTEREFRS